MRGRILRRYWAVVVVVMVGLLGFANEAAAQSCIKPKDSPTPADIEQAKKHMAAGVAFMQDPEGARYEEAYPEFKKAYNLSGSLNALQNLAICAMKLELDGEALECFQRFLTEKGEDLEPADKEQVENDMRALQAAVAWVTLTADRPGVKVMDTRTPRRGATVRNTYIVGLQPVRLGIHPGSHEFVASSDDVPDAKWEIEIKNGAVLNHEFIFDDNKPVTADGFTEKDMEGVGGEKKPTPADGGTSRPIPGYVWGVVGITGAALVAGAVTAGLAASAKGDYDDNLRGKVPVAEQQAAVDDIKTKNLVADVMWGVAGAGAITTIILIVTRPEVPNKPGDGEAKEDARGFGHQWTVAPLIDPRGGGGAALTATF